MAIGINIGFRPGDRVRIIALEQGHGIVIGVLLELGGTTYNVRYWHNGDAKTAWLTWQELERAEP